MFNRQRKWFRWLSAAILVLLCLYLLQLNQGLFRPLIVVFNAIFAPFVVTIIFYYLFRPLVNYLSRRKIPRVLAVLLIYIAGGAALAGIVFAAGPFLSRQFQGFVEQIPQMVEFVTDGLESLRNGDEMLAPSIREALPDLGSQIGSQWNEYATSVGGSFIRVFSWVSNMLVVLSLVPFILYYALIDGDRLAPSLIQRLPEAYRDDVSELCKELDGIISSFIWGKAIVSLILGALLLVGYSVIGLEYALVLAIFAMFANIIPFFGQVIGAAPAVLVAWIQEPIMALYIVIITIIAQQIEGNFISPQLMGRTLDIHPVTVIALILAAGSVAGLLGILFVVPIYAIAKVLVVYAIKLHRSHPETNRTVPKG